ncbi:hypothetical protein SLS61_003502 [Didymella pomorum]
MSNAQQVHAVAMQSQDSLDDAEKGMYDSTVALTAPHPFVYTSEGQSTHLNPLLSPASPVHEGITPCTSVPELALPKASKSEVSHVEVVEEPKKPTPVKPKISRWILFELWFNVYRRFFTFVVIFNLIGIILAATGHFRYAENHLGALVLGNLLMAILMRNELFVRFLYLIAIYGLRSMTWVFVIMGNTYDIKRGQWRTDSHSLLSAQELWFAVFMTVFVLIPWVTLREVPVEVEIPSPKVAVLKFERGMQQGLLGRISRTSVMEYHAFGIISEGRKATHHYMICGVQGDFTKNLVANPPKTVWTRQLKFAGVGHASAMYKRGIRICTGTGIGAALSTCIQSPDWFLIWIGSNQERTFGPTITGLIRKHIEPERMILWDSKKRGGRPDSVQLLKDTWKSWGAEVIYITSNMQGNDEMMQGCRAAGLHAFGTLWDF